MQKSEVRYMRTAMHAMLGLFLSLTLAFCGDGMAYADTPIEFYEQLAEAYGVVIDLAGETWGNRTKSAYLAYILANDTIRNCNDVYSTGLALQDLTGYDVVYVDEGRYYLNSCPDSSGGAFYSIDLSDPTNFGSAANELFSWLRYAVDTGPAWPGGGSSSGGGSGGDIEVGDTYVFIPLYEWNSRYTCASNHPDCVITTRTLYDALTVDGGVVTAAFRCIDGYALVGNIYCSPSVAWYDVLPGDNPGNYPEFYQRLAFGVPTSQIMTMNGSDRLITVGGKTGYNFTDGVVHVGTSAGTFNYSDMADVVGSSVYPITLRNHGGVGDIEGDDTVPSPDSDRRPITWPSITFPSLPDFSPTVNITDNGNYNATTGEIDFSPITERLDIINQNLEYFYQTFSSFWSDFLTFMDSLGQGLDDLNNAMWYINDTLMTIRDWVVNIFYKIGAGGASVPDVTTNQDGFWDWLHNLVDAVFKKVPQGIHDMIDTVAELTGYFPFSMPWDMYALLSLFVAEPVAPVITLPYPVPESVRQSKHIDLIIDLSGYEQVAAAMRQVQMVFFCFWLAWITPTVVKGINVLSYRME